MYKIKNQVFSNKSRILECIYRNAPISRIEISELTDITPATITTIVSTFIRQGIVRELEETNSHDSNTPGRKKIPIDIVADYAYTIGIEFTEKALVLCITNIKGNLITQTSVPFQEEIAYNITEEIIFQLEGFIQDSNISKDNLLGIGIAVPGHMDSDNKKLITNSSIWCSFNPKLIEETFSLPVVSENNVRSMALYKYLFHPAASPDNYAFFHVGLGMYCANIIDGDIFKGSNYSSGEIGHAITHINGRRCECGKHGCLQTVASEQWLLKICRYLYEHDLNSILPTIASTKEAITIEHVITAYELGDKSIGKYINEALISLGATTSNIAILTSPEKIFLHGQLFSNHNISMDLIDYIKDQLLFIDNDYKDIFEILPYSLVDGALGGSALAILHFLIQ